MDVSMLTSLSHIIASSVNTKYIARLIQYHGRQVEQMYYGDMPTTAYLTDDDIPFGDGLVNEYYNSQITARHYYTYGVDAAPWFGLPDTPSVDTTELDFCDAPRLKPRFIASPDSIGDGEADDDDSVGTLYGCCLSPNSSSDSDKLGDAPHVRSTLEVSSVSDYKNDAEVTKVQRSLTEEFEAGPLVQPVVRIKNAARIKATKKSKATKEATAPRKRTSKKTEKENEELLAIYNNATIDSDLSQYDTAIINKINERITLNIYNEVFPEAKIKHNTEAHGKDGGYTDSNELPQAVELKVSKPKLDKPKSKYKANWNFVTSLSEEKLIKHLRPDQPITENELSAWVYSINAVKMSGMIIISHLTPGYSRTSYVYHLTGPAFCRWISNYTIHNAKLAEDKEKAKKLAAEEDPEAQFCEEKEKEHGYFTVEGVTKYMEDLSAYSADKSLKKPVPPKTTINLGGRWCPECKFNHRIINIVVKLYKGEYPAFGDETDNTACPVFSEEDKKIVNRVYFAYEHK